jgi:hypothetical protein
MVGDYQHHTGMTLDLFADNLGKSDDALMIYTAQRILNGDSAGDNTNIFDQQSQFNTNAYATRLACGSVALDRGRTLFGKDNVHWQPQIYLRKDDSTIGDLFRVRISRGDPKPPLGAVLLVTYNLQQAAESGKLMHIPQILAWSWTGHGALTTAAVFIANFAVCFLRQIISREAFYGDI